MKNLIFVTCIIFSLSLTGQNISNDDVVGVYKERSNDPVGGATFIFLPDHTYVIAYFGGFQKGVWELNGEKVIYQLGRAILIVKKLTRQTIFNLNKLIVF